MPDNDARGEVARLRAELTAFKSAQAEAWPRWVSFPEQRATDLATAALDLAERLVRELQERDDAEVDAAIERDLNEP